MTFATSNIHVQSSTNLCRVFAWVFLVNISRVMIMKKKLRQVNTVHIRNNGRIPGWFPIDERDISNGFPCKQRYSVNTGRTAT